MRSQCSDAVYLEIVEHFKSDKGFLRLIDSMADTYARHGRVFGAVRLTYPSKEEERALSGFFERDYFDQALIRISLADFERRIQKNFDSSAMLADVLDRYNSTRQAAKSVERRFSHKHVDSFSAALKTVVLPRFKGTHAESWINDISTHMRRTYRPWVGMHSADPKNALKMVRVVATALNKLPEGKDELLPIEEFSEKILGSPFALDYNGTHGSLFVRALAHRSGVPVPNSAEESVELYANNGLLYGGILISVTVLGLAATSADGAPDGACEFYKSLNQPHVLTLENLSRLKNAYAACDKVFVIQDPLVYSDVCRRLHGVNCTLISPVGAQDTALLHLLKLFDIQKTAFYYAANMSYKGLAAADKIYLELGKSFKPWRMGRDDYELITQGDDTGLLTERKPLSLHNDELAGLLSFMRKSGKTSSSIPLAPFMAEDIRVKTDGRN